MQIHATVKLSLIVTLLLSGSLNSHAVARDTLSQDKQEKAAQLWEQAIAAKGGRERLHAVRNLYVSKQFNNCQDCVEDELHVFPDRWWWFKKFPYLKDINVCNFELAQCWGVHWNTEKRFEGAFVRTPLAVRHNKLQILSPQWFLLMETRWMKPKLIEARSAWVGLKLVDVVRAHFDFTQEKIDLYVGVTVDYYLDRKTRLPIKIKVKWDEPVGLESSSRLDDYTEVDGIKLPQRSALELPLFADPEHKEPEHYRYQVNVNVDESIFNQPPNANLNRDAWQRRQ